MPFKLSVQTVVAALIAGASAFGGAYQLAIGDGAMTGFEWVNVAWVTATAVAGAFYHQKRDIWTAERRAVEASGK